MEVSSAEQLESAFKARRESPQRRTGADSERAFRSDQIGDPRLALEVSSLPSISIRGEFVANGGLMSYGPDRAEPFRRAAAMVDKILKGTKPSDIPVEQPTKFELVINLKTAKQIGLTIPPNVLVRSGYSDQMNFGF